MKETYTVTIGKGEEAFTVYYDDYSDACECALAYRQQGMSVRVELPNNEYFEF